MCRPVDGGRTAKRHQANRLSGASFWVAIVVLLIQGTALAQRGGGAPITLTFESVSGGLPVSGAGTDTASVNFGNVSAFKPVGAGVTRSSTATDYTISTPFGVKVTKSGGTSPNYTLQARLMASHALTWRINSVAMSTTYATVGSTLPYASTISHTLEFVVPLTHAAGAVTTQFQVLAISN